MKLKRAGIITWIIIIALVVSLSVMLINKINQINERREQVDDLSHAIVDKEITNADMQYKLDHKDDDDVIEDFAREELDMVKPGEIVFYDSAE